MAINFVKMFDPEATQDSQGAYKQKMALAQSLLSGDTGALYSNGAVAAKVAEKAFGGWMARSIQDEENKANNEAGAAIANALMNWGGAGGSSGVPTSSAAPASSPVATSPFAASIGNMPDPEGPSGDAFRSQSAAIEAPKGQRAFIDGMMPYAMEASQATGVDPRIIIAQGALESAWGKSAPGNNFFGIKSHGQPGGQDLATTEVVNGQPVQTTDSFRTYGGMGDSVKGYADFINSNPRYAGLKQAQGLDAQIAALQASGYATDPDYGKKIASIAGRIQLPMQAGQPGHTQVASLDPSIGIAGGASAPAATGPQMAPTIPSAVPQASAPAAPVQVAQAGPAQSNPLAAALQAPPAQSMTMTPQQQETVRQLLGNPRTRQAGMALIQQQQAQAVEAQRLQQQRAWDVQKLKIEQANKDREFDLNKRKTDAELNKPILVDGALIDPNTKQPVYSSPKKPMTVGKDSRLVSEDGTVLLDADKSQNTEQLDKATAELRKEILGLPSYKSVAGANPAFKSMVDAAKRDDKAADLNMVYALAKIMDPSSVVREGEIQMANDTQGAADKLNGFIKSIQGEGRLAPAARLGLLQEARSRMEAFKSAYDTDRSFYRGIVTRRGYNEADVIPDFGELPNFDPAEISSIKRGDPGAAPPPDVGHYEYDPVTRSMKKVK